MVIYIGDVIEKLLGILMVAEVILLFPLGGAFFATWDKERDTVFRDNCKKVFKVLINVFIVNLVLIILLPSKEAYLALVQ